MYFKKHNNLFFNLFKVLFCFSLIFTLSTGNNNNVYAVNVCEPELTVFQKIKSMLKSVDIRATITNMIASSFTDGITNITFNGSYSEVIGCQEYMRNNMPEMRSVVDGLSEEAQACTVVDEDFCASLIDSYADVRVAGRMLPYEGRVQGSLVGLARTIEPGLSEPPVVNLAYYGNRQVAKLPFTEGVLAQAGGSSYVGFDVLLDAVYDIWEVFRNVAYGVMAIVMVVVGIMIMTRKKINPQSVVTLQYAIPRIIIALILITFSYPIGAALASLSYALSLSAGEIVRSFGLTTGTDSLMAILAGALIFILAGVLSTGVGLFLLVVLGVALIVTVISWMAAMIKFYILYIKLLMEIIFSPITFTLGAVPGNEDKTIGWFKKVFALGLGMFALRGIIVLTMTIAFRVLETFASSQDFGAIMVAAIIGPFFIFFLLIFGFNQARKIPDKISEAIVGDGKRR